MEWINPGRDLFDWVTAAAAFLGAGLGLWSLNQRRVKLRVRPEWSDGPFAETFAKAPIRILGQGLRVTVVNMSAFPMTICDVGFIERRTKQRLSLRNDAPNLQGLRLPVRLDPRERLQSVLVPDPTKSKFKVLDKAYAVTACEVER